MSHFTKVSSKLSSLTAIKQALISLGFAEADISLNEKSKMTCRGYGSSKRKANLIVKNACRYGDLGFELEADGSVTIHMDDEDRRRYNEEWLGKLQMGHDESVVREQIEENGWVIIEDGVDEEGQVYIRVDTLR